MIIRVSRVYNVGSEFSRGRVGSACYEALGSGLYIHKST